MAQESLTPAESPPALDQYPLPLPYSWREDTDYNYTSRITRRQWAWEFLRRNPDYQRAWLAAAQVYSDKMQKRYTRSVQIPDILESEESLSHWGINQYVNPAVADLGFKKLTENMCLFPTGDQLIFGREFIASMAPNRGIKVDIEHFDIKRHALGVFDVTLPPGPQIKKMKARLEELHEKRMGAKLNQGLKDTSAFRGYIRHLDALAAGAETAEIKDRLYSSYSSPETSYNQNENAAKGLRDGEYRRLL